MEKTPSQWNGVLVSKRRSLVSKKGKNTSQTGKQFRKYFYCFCLAEALLAEAEVEKTPVETCDITSRRCSELEELLHYWKVSLAILTSTLHWRIWVWVRSAEWFSLWVHGQYQTILDSLQVSLVCKLPQTIVPLLLVVAVISSPGIMSTFQIQRNHNPIGNDTKMVLIETLFPWYRSVRCTSQVVSLIGSFQNGIRTVWSAKCPTTHPREQNDRQM